MKTKTSSFPFPPSRVPFHYGWVILFSGAFGIVLSVPGQTIGLSPFTDHLIRELGISREKLSLAYCIGTATSSLLLTLAGMAYDRFGVRIVGVGTGIMMGLTLAGLSRVDKAARMLQYVFTEAEPAVLAFVSITVGFFCLRFFGQGVMAVISRNMVMKWFDRRRGFANGIVGLMVGAGFPVAPKLFDVMINKYTWHGAWLGLALAIGITFAGMALVLFRDNPEDCGLKPDANLPAPRASAPPAFHPSKDRTLAEAVKTYSFWVFTFGMGLFALYVTALTFHITSVFKTAGMTRDSAIAIFIPSAVIAVAFQLAGNLLSDYIKLKYLLVAELGGLAISMVSLLCLAPGWPVAAMIIGNGIFQGMFGVLIGVTYPRFFGRTHLGAVSGLATTIIVAGSAVGPYLFSLSKKQTGGYERAAAFCLAGTLLLLLCALRANHPNAASTRGSAT